jgi:hypothetical protein
MDTLLGLVHSFYIILSGATEINLTKNHDFRKPARKIDSNQTHDSPIVEIFAPYKRSLKVLKLFPWKCASYRPRASFAVECIAVNCTRLQIFGYESVTEELNPTYLQLGFVTVEKLKVNLRMVIVYVSRLLELWSVITSMKRTLLVEINPSDIKFFGGQTACALSL